MESYTVSVAMCTYNGSKYIAEQLESILNQTVVVDEIVIYDDCSTDNTVEIINHILQNSNIKHTLVVGESNVGTGPAFLKCIEMCIGDIIFPSDQDDVWLPNKVACMLEKFRINPNCVLAICDGYVVDEQLNMICESNWDAAGLKEAGFSGSSTTKEMYWKILMYRWIAYGSMMSFRRTFMMKTFPYPLDTWTHDSWLAVTAPIYGDIAIIDDSLIKYRQHGNNVCGAGDNYNKNEKQRLIFHMQHLFFHLQVHEKRIADLLMSKGNEMTPDDKKMIEQYHTKFKDIKSYQTSSNMKKLLYLCRFWVTGELKMFCIDRKAVFSYFMSLLVKR